MRVTPPQSFNRTSQGVSIAPVRGKSAVARLAGSILAVFLMVTPPAVRAYVLEGQSWPAGAVVVFQLGLGDAGRTLIDGNTSWNAAAAPALDMWDQNIQRAQLTSVSSTASVSSGDLVNSVVFSSTIFGQSFGSGTLAVTYYRMQSSRMIEADVLFNLSQNFDSYRGALRFSNGHVIADIRRVLVHELGHALGLTHPDSNGQHVDAIMNSMVSDRETLSTDDISGGQSLYGAPVASTPTPTPTPIPPPVATPSVGPSHLANISTRMNVGVNNEVLIGGFIVSGAQPKNLILRAIGPSLTGAEVAGAMADPMLELHDSTGATIATNDNWQTSAQASEISASGLAPANPLESAIIATLPTGNYTAIVRGVKGVTGIGMIEAYEFDSTDTRLVNISTRGRVGLNNDVLIGGFIVSGSQSKTVVLRATGPSLIAAGITDALSDPTVELHDASGTIVATNDDWQSSAQASQINASGLAPNNALESAIMATVTPGNYTAIVRGFNGGTGVGMVEVYDLDP